MIKGAVQDVFDGACKKELDELYEDKMWSDIKDDFKQKLKKELKNSLIALKKEVSIF